MTDRKEDARGKAGMASRFARVRRDHAGEMAEDYAEMILELEEDGLLPVRPADLARRLGVSHVTVLRALDRLVRNGVLLRDGSQGILLSPMGRELGEGSRARHRLVVRVLEKLGVPHEVAVADGEGMEHHISLVTLERMAAWVEKP